MRTTIDIPDSVLHRARQRAVSRGTKLKAVVSDALRTALGEPARERADGVTVPTYGGSGFAAGVTEADLFSREERDFGAEQHRAGTR